MSPIPKSMMLMLKQQLDQRHGVVPERFTKVQEV